MEALNDLTCLLSVCCPLWNYPLRVRSSPVIRYPSSTTWSSRERTDEAPDGSRWSGLRHPASVARDATSCGDQRTMAPPSKQTVWYNGMIQLYDTIVWYNGMIQLYNTIDWYKVAIQLRRLWYCSQACWCPKQQSKDSFLVANLYSISSIDIIKIVKPLSTYL